ncbi:hypothetical protein BDF20DRAFT_290924 [Mycotypha africana]|uniref:uncharacterized protein n=1 Tax=Mycotypha africana TaxID=64632 RepID=UPI002300B904|nr:uncharacterized protein BDF20DRAFT_290924 [Mycotypha africana]KAI8987822.1 hypothetical protein BDF20DRAFT_290924 [Mycotypha africana]
MAKKGNKRKSHKKNKRPASHNNKINSNNSNISKVEEAVEPTMTSDLAQSDAPSPSTSSSINSTTNKEEIKHSEEQGQEKEKDVNNSINTATIDEDTLGSLLVGGVIVKTISLNQQDDAKENSRFAKECLESNTADHRAAETRTPDESMATSESTCPSEALGTNNQEEIRTTSVSENQVNNSKTMMKVKNDEAHVQKDAAIGDKKAGSQGLNTPSAGTVIPAKEREEENPSVTADHQEQQEANLGTNASKLNISVSDDVEQFDTSLTAAATAAAAALEEIDNLFSVSQAAVEQKPDVDSNPANSTYPSAESKVKVSDATTENTSTLDEESFQNAAVNSFAKTTPTISITEPVSTPTVEEPEREEENIKSDKSGANSVQEYDVANHSTTTTTTTTAGTIVTTKTSVEKPACTKEKEEKAEATNTTEKEGKANSLSTLERNKQGVDEGDQQEQQQPIERHESVTEETLTVGSQSEQSVNTAVAEVAAIAKESKTSSTFLRKSSSVFLRKESGNKEDKAVTKRKSQIISLFKRTEKTPSSPLTQTEKDKGYKKKTDDTQKPEEKLKKRRSWLFWKSSSTKNAKTVQQH